MPPKKEEKIQIKQFKDSSSNWFVNNAHYCLNKDNEIVLDNACGSGTTAMACMNTNRRWICIEKEEKYCKISKERIEKHNNGNS